MCQLSNLEQDEAQRCTEVKQVPACTLRYLITLSNCAGADSGNVSYVLIVIKLHFTADDSTAGGILVQEGV